MNKKRLIVFLILVLIIISIVFVVINNKNKAVDNKEEVKQEEKVVEHTNQEWKDCANKYYEKETGNTASDIILYSDNKDVMIIEIYDSTDENAHYVEKYNLDYKTGKGTDLHGNSVDLEIGK